jgi:selenide,water dikinase
MYENNPVQKDIVLVGGGHSHLPVLKRFGMKPEPGVRLTLIARDVDTPYSGMLPGLVSGHYSHGEAHIDLGPLARFAGARLYHAAATGIDTARRLVYCEGRPPVPYDLLSLDVGSRPARAAIAGAAEHAIPVKPVDQFLRRWRLAEEDIVGSAGGARILVVGAGAGGVELSLCLHYCLTEFRGLPEGELEITLVTDLSAPLAGHSGGVRRRMSAALTRANIRLLTDTAAVRFDSDRLHCANGKEIPFDVAILTTHASAPPWLAGSGLALDADGFVAVDRNLRSLSHPEVFAAGDVASFQPRRLPKSGVYAVREGLPLERNLRRAAKGLPLRPYRPQKRTLALISTGDRNAVASYGALSLEGAWLWRVKDWIDRRFMEKFQNLPQMTQSDPARTDEYGHPLDMRCGGCGAKVAGPVLRNVLTRLRPRFDEDVLVGLETPDDAAVIRTAPGLLNVQSVDHFRAFIDDPYLFGRIAAVHALGDIFAMGATPTTALALATLPYAPAAKLEADLYALLSGVLETLSEEGACLVGGHTGEGAELALGLSVNGAIEESAVMRKAGLSAGDKLVLTKPLGTGCIFAADMKAEAPGSAVQNALATMLQSNAQAARLIGEHGAKACTDVTGFGLAGHLIEMLEASQATAEIEPAALPALPGALELLARGTVSSLQGANEVFGASIAGGQEQDPRYRLLFDPQTAGGLLAGIPAAQAPDCLTALRDAGYEAAIIGDVGGPEDGLPIRLP